MTEQPDMGPVAAAISLALANLAEVLAPVLEAARGYRHQCLEQGFSEHAADEMAVDYHHIVLRMIVDNMGAKKK